MKIISFNKIISNTIIYPVIIPADSEKNVVPIVPFVTTGTSSPTKRNFSSHEVTDRRLVYYGNLLGVLRQSTIYVTIIYQIDADYLYPAICYY